MKKLITLPILLLFLCCGTSKNIEQDTPDSDFKEVTVNVNPYIEKLGLEDKDALVIAMSESTVRCMCTENNFLVMLSDGRMFKYATTDEDYKGLKSMEVTDAAEKERLAKTVNSINDIDTDTFKNPPARVLVSDRSSYNLEIYKGTTCQTFNVYAPEMYIVKKLPRYKERKKLVKVLKALDFYNELFKY
ncbi:hypothetical protein [Flavobacterium alkalisoli]|uniref:hypothetical protein n=1 Tax=Flavobacterium alkalisoli TaxID=2602769 RepID=UPI003A8E3971